jgi:hypothetical protein
MTEETKKVTETKTGHPIKCQACIGTSCWCLNGYYAAIKLELCGKMCARWCSKGCFDETKRRYVRELGDHFDSKIVPALKFSLPTGSPCANTLCAKTAIGIRLYSIATNPNWPGATRTWCSGTCMFITGLGKSEDLPRQKKPAEEPWREEMDQLKARIAELEEKQREGSE